MKDAPTTLPNPEDEKTPKEDAEPGPGPVIGILAVAVVFLLVLCVLTARYWSPHGKERPVNLKGDDGGWAELNNILRVICAPLLLLVSTIGLAVALRGKTDSLDAFAGVIIVLTIPLLVVAALDSKDVRAALDDYCAEEFTCRADPFVAICAFDLLCVLTCSIAAAVLIRHNHAVDAYHARKAKVLDGARQDAIMRKAEEVQRSRMGATDTCYLTDTYVVKVDAPGFVEGDNTLLFKVEGRIPNSLLHVYGTRDMGHVPNSVDAGISERVPRFERTYALPPSCGPLIPSQSHLHAGVATLAFESMQIYSYAGSL